MLGYDELKKRELGYATVESNINSTVKNVTQASEVVHPQEQPILPL